jgi:hypothetical protein
MRELWRFGPHSDFTELGSPGFLMAMIMLSVSVVLLVMLFAVPQKLDSRCEFLTEWKAIGLGRADLPPPLHDWKCATVRLRGDQ